MDVSTFNYFAVTISNNCYENDGHKRDLKVYQVVMLNNYLEL